MATPTTDDQFNAFVSALGEKFLDLTGTMSETEKAMRKLEKRYETSADGIKNLKDSIDQGSASALDNVANLAEFKKQIRLSGKTIDAETQARIKAIESEAKKEMAIKGALTGFQVLATVSIDLAIKGFKTLVTNLQGTGDAFTTFTALAKQGLQATDQAAQAASDGLKALGVVLLPISGAARIAGAGLILLGEYLGWFSKTTTDLSEFALDILNNEIQKTIKVFQDNSKASMFFGNGMSALADEFTKAKMSYRDFLGALKNSSEDLARIGGNAGAGAIAVKNTTMALKDFRKGLLNLGVSLEEQVQGAAEYMAMLARTGTIQRMNSVDLAKGTDAYLTNLKIITTITGEEAKAAQARAKKASEQLATQTKLNQLGAGATVKFRTAVERFGPGFEQALQQLLTDKTITNPETAAMLAQTPRLLDALNQAIADVEDTSVDSNQALARMNRNIADPALGQDLSSLADTLGRVNNLLGGYGEQMTMASRLQQENFQGQHVGYKMAENTVKDQKTTTDALTNSISNATLKFAEMQSIIDQKLKDPITRFADVVDQNLPRIIKVYDDIDKYVRSLFDKPPPVVNTGPITTLSQAKEVARNEVPGVVMPTPGSQEAREMFLRRREAEEMIRRGSRESRGKITYPEKEDGGIVNQPSIAGEAGPEAVIPLKNGGIPMQIDFGPMIQQLATQSALTQEMLREMRETRDIQNRILEASY